MGAFLIAVVEMLRITVYLIGEKLQKMSGNNAAVKAIVCCANCCMACLEKIVEYINDGAYAYMAVTGDSFCTSAWNGFMLCVKHSLEFAWAKILAELFIFMGKISLVSLNMFFFTICVKYITDDAAADTKG